MRLVLAASWSEERGSSGRQPNWGKQRQASVPQAKPDTPLSIKHYDGQRYRVHQVEDKVEPIIYLGLDEGADVNDLDIVGLMHHHSLDVSRRPPPSG